ncbi:MAG: PfkB family carbohydrate kinase [Candidatus Thalassarchaeaceae archaeon]|jgi:sugar/nucleoside kinase (ribokinase family)|nr:PfkB family carbohydrate kinase [Candidatus Thalassarchaeaceae archaeon]
MDIVIVGSLAYDELETEAGKVANSLGGSGTFAGLAAAFHAKRRLDSSGSLPLGLVCAIGDDFAQSDSDTLRQSGLNLDGIETIEGGRTFRWHGRYEGDMDQAITIETQQNVLEGYEPKVPVSWWAPRVLFLANNHPSIQSHVLDQCEGAKFTAMDSMNLWITTAFPELSSVLRRVDLAILNENEVRMIAKDENLIRAGESIREGSALTGGSESGPGPSILIIKKGEHGSIVLTDMGMLTLPAFPTAQIVDPTGCGDSFAGTILTFLSESTNTIPSLDELHNAVVHATVTASFTIADFGIAGLVELDRGEYHARLDTYRRMVGLN